VLEYFGTENTVEFDNLPERMLYCSDSNFRQSENKLTIYSNLAGFVALLLAGLFVLLVTSSFFSSYFLAIAGIH